MKVFTSPVVEEKPIEFSIDDDTFYAIPAARLPGGALESYFKSVGAGDIFVAHTNFFRTVLDEGSFKLFEERFNSKDKPITLQMLAEVSAWLLGEGYMGNGESVQEVPSTTGRKVTKSGRNSTAGAVAKV